MNKLKHILSLSVILALSSCQEEPKSFIEIKPEFKWRLIGFEDSDKRVDKDSFVQFRWSVYNTNGDSLYGTRLFIKIDSVPETGLLKSLSLLKVNETGEFVFPFKYLELPFQQQLTHSDEVFDNKGTYHHKISIDESFSLEEFKQKKLDFLDWVNEQEPVDFNSIENKVISNYVNANELEVTTLNSGLRYYIKGKSNSGVKPKYGKWIKIRHKGGALHQQQKHMAVMQDFYVGQELQVIRALEETILQMELGDTAVAIAPSNLAFGEKGSGSGIIPPSTPVYYEIIILELDED